MKKRLSLSVIALGLTVAYSQANMETQGHRNSLVEKAMLTEDHQGRHATKGLEKHNSSTQTHTLTMHNNKQHSLGKSEHQHPKAQKQKHNTRHFFK